MGSDESYVTGGRRILDCVLGAPQGDWAAGLAWVRGYALE